LNTGRIIDESFNVSMFYKAGGEFESIYCQTKMIPYIIFTVILL